MRQIRTVDLPQLGNDIIMDAPVSHELTHHLLETGQLSKRRVIREPIDG